MAILDAILDFGHLEWKEKNGTLFFSKVYDVFFQIKLGFALPGNIHKITNEPTL